MRILKIAAVVLGVLLVAVGSVVAATFLGRKPIVDGLEINGIRMVKDSMASVAVIPTGPGQVALIDAGIDKTGKAIIAELARRQLTPDAVTAILLTHGHSDHIASIAMFPKAEVMALEPDVALVEGRAGAHGPATRWFPVSPTGFKVGRVLHDGDTITLGQTAIRVFAVPGHTAGSAAYLVNGILFLGDAADSTSNGKIEGAPWIFSDSQAQDRDSLARLDRRLIQEHADVKVIVFAHSGLLAEGLTPLTAFVEKNP